MGSDVGDMWGITWTLLALMQSGEDTARGEPSEKVFDLPEPLERLKLHLRPGLQGGGKSRSRWWGARAAAREDELDQEVGCMEWPPTAIPAWI